MVGEEDAELVGSYFGVKEGGNVPAKNDQHGALRNQVSHSDPCMRHILINSERFASSSLDTRAGGSLRLLPQRRAHYSRQNLLGAGQAETSS